MKELENTYKEVLLNEIYDVVLAETQKLNKGVLTESTKKSTALICEEMKVDFNKYVELNNDGLESKAIREAIIKIDLYERLGIYRSAKGLKMLVECIDKLSSEPNFLNEDYVPAYAATAYKGAEHATDDDENSVRDFGMTAGILTGFEAAKHGIGYAKAAAHGTKYVPKSTAGQALMFGRGKSLSKNTASVMTKGGELTAKGMTKLFKVLGKWFPKLLKLVPKVAAWGTKAARIAAVGATWGAWLVVEAILLVISLGGKAFIQSNTKASAWSVKKLIGFYRKWKKTAAFIDAIWQVFGYADIKKLVLKKGIKLGYITSEEANEIERSSSLFGDKFANDFSDVEGPDDGAFQDGNQTVRKAVGAVGKVVSGIRPPTIQQVFKEIAPLSDKNGWLANARKLGWPEEKIQQYRTIINNYYKNKQISEINNKQDMDTKEVIKESIGGGVFKGGEKIAAKNAGKTAAKAGRFARPNKVVTNAAKHSDDAARSMEALGNTPARKMEGKSQKLVAMLDNEVKVADAVSKQADKVITQLNKQGVQVLAEAGVKLSDVTKVAFKRGTDGMIIAFEKGNPSKTLARLKPKDLMNIMTKFKGANKKLSDEVLKLDKQRKALTNARKQTTKLANQEKAARLASLDSQIQHCNQSIRLANQLKSKNAKIMAAIAACLGLGGGYMLGSTTSDSGENGSANGEVEPGNETQPVIPGGGGGGGRSDERVRRMQRALNEAGYTDYEGRRLVEDGILGPRTKSAAEKAGIDPNTWDGDPALRPANGEANGGEGLEGQGDEQNTIDYSDEPAYAIYLGGAGATEIRKFQYDFGLADENGQVSGIYDRETARKAHELATEEGNNKFKAAGSTIKGYFDHNYEQDGYNSAMKDVALRNLNDALDKYASAYRGAQAQKKVNQIRQEIEDQDFNSALYVAERLGDIIKRKKIIALINAYKEACLGNEEERQTAINEVKTNFFSILERINNATILM